MSKKKSIDKDKPKGGSPKAASSPKKINKMNKPDTPFFMVSGSAIGKSHKGTGTPCQDSSFCGTLSNGWGIAIVCDGAGSAANSQQ
ncbi:MAG: hypothetical protein EBX41_02485, partial [Chitinophagia bacterium]|nr:hypothetical protein [Chitinophagia bacterium]